jgi:hypothetical protein
MGRLLQRPIRTIVVKDLEMEPGTAKVPCRKERFATSLVPLGLAIHRDTGIDLVSTVLSDIY